MIERFIICVCLPVLVCSCFKEEEIPQDTSLQISLTASSSELGLGEPGWVWMGQVSLGEFGWVWFSGPRQQMGMPFVEPQQREVAVWDALCHKRKS